MNLTDQVTFDEATARITRDGYLVADAFVARTGIQTYRAGELGMADRNPADVIRVYRSPDEVFAADALASIAHRPITLDHPSETVTAANWSRYAKGDIGDEVVRDGNRIRVPIKLMDAAAIEDVRTSRRQFSLGYTCDLVWGEGKTPEGETYDARQTSIRVNHLAACVNARGGPELRIIDERRDAPQSTKDSPVTLKTLIIDGLHVADVSPAAEAAIQKLQGQVAALTSDATAKDAKIGELTAATATKDGEIAALKQEVTDAKVTPAKLQEMAAARAAVIDTAKKIAPALTVTDTMTDAEIRKAAVGARLGDAAKDLTDDGITGAFKALAPVTTDSLAQVIGQGVSNVGDAQTVADKAWKDQGADLNAWRNKAA